MFYYENCMRSYLYKRGTFCSVLNSSENQLATTYILAVSPVKIQQTREKRVTELTFVFFHLHVNIQKPVLCYRVVINFGVFSFVVLLSSTFLFRAESPKLFHSMYGEFTLPCSYVASKHSLDKLKACIGCCLMTIQEKL